jgi:ubiquinone/menaquinone biosynthesis C-methylase UbiE
MRILDLGCGSGYLSFPIAADHPGCEVTGLDIVSEALNADHRRAEKEGRDNLTFVNYDGMDFPLHQVHLTGSLRSMHCITFRI